MKIISSGIKYYTLEEVNALPAPNLASYKLSPRRKKMRSRAGSTTLSKNEIDIIKSFSENLNNIARKKNDTFSKIK